MHDRTLQLPSSVITALTPLQVVGNGSGKGILWDGLIPELEWKKSDCSFFLCISLKKNTCKAIVLKAACWGDKTQGHT